MHAKTNSVLVQCFYILPCTETRVSRRPCAPPAPASDIRVQPPPPHARIADTAAYASMHGTIHMDWHPLRNTTADKPPLPRASNGQHITHTTRL